MSPAEPLAPFSPAVRSWFERRFGEPTAVQREAWPPIARGEHVLLTAPTGSGKTFAAFLWAVDRLLSGSWTGGAVRVVYVSPLRALGNDIRRNLTGPLEELRRLAPETAAVAVATRTGDTPEAERRRMLRHPPEILITTPESLNILLTSARGEGLLGEVRTVIVDEIHAVVDSPRGVHLISAVERLARLAGEVQRIALSATVHPADEVARWIGGATRPEDRAEAPLRPRAVRVVAPAQTRRPELRVELPAAADDPDSYWQSLTAALRRTVRRNRSTLVFANSRRTVEKVARMLNADADRPLAWSHHGALSREVRAVVEERLKAGTLSAIVATSSLELGIDVGAIDEVALVGTPTSAASTLQRIGRSGHTVGGTSRGVLYPLHRRDLLFAAAVARAAVDGELEPARPVHGALDVLAQICLSIVCRRAWRADELYAFVTTFAPYRRLPRRHFDLVLEMLAGRYASTRLRSLRPLVRIDPVDGTVTARPGAERMIYLSGGTIPDRGYFRLRLEGSGALLGELDEEFVWERSVGDAFTLGVQTWRVDRITSADVFVSPAGARAAMAPFWRAEEQDRPYVLAERVGRLLEILEPLLDDEEAARAELRRYHLGPAAVRALYELLLEQRARTGALPHRRRVVVEHTWPGDGRSDHRQLVLHTVWGGRVNRPLAYALAGAWERELGHRPEVVHDDACVMVVYPAADRVADPLALVPPGRVSELLRATLEDTGFFGARFREAAGRALLLPRGLPGRRTPLWLNRQRAKELRGAVTRWSDFPLALEAWRSCLDDAFEMEALEELLEEVRDGEIEVHQVHTDRPSPFSADAVWRRTNALMYEDDRSGSRGGAAADLVRELAVSSRLRPRVPRSEVDRLEAKLQRTAPGYAPRDGNDLLDHLEERLWITDEEWRDLLGAVERDHGLLPAEVVDSVERRPVRLHLGDRDLLVALTNLPRFLAAVGVTLAETDLRSPDGSPAAAAAVADAQIVVARAGPEAPDEALPEALGQWLQTRGPTEIEEIRTSLPVASDRLTGALAVLVDAGRVVVDELTVDAEGPQACDLDNLDRLLRALRRSRRPSFEPRPLELLPLLLADTQRVGVRDADPDALAAAVEPLFGLAIPVERWETEVLPARVDPYLPPWLDALFADTELRWVGAGDRQVMLAPAGDLELFPRAADDPSELEATLEELFPQPAGRFRFEDLLLARGVPAADLAETLWRLVWAGLVTADSFGPVRDGVARGFRPPPEPRPRGRRTRFGDWRSSQPLSGSFFTLPRDAETGDLLDEAELAQERARAVLQRYGVVFRELLEREPPPLRFGALFQTLRLMELSGEVVAGRFFEGVPGLQLATPATVARMESGLDEDRIWWMGAADPASPCGMGLAELPFGDLPRRVSGSFLVMHGRRLVVTAENRARRLQIKVPPGHPLLPDYLEVLRHLLGRKVRPVRRLQVETVNGDAAVRSPYREVLESIARTVASADGLRLEKRY